MNNTFKPVAGSENMKELYKSPLAKVIDIAGESVICTSISNGEQFSLGDDRTIERGDDNDWGDNLNW